MLLNAYHKGLATLITGGFGETVKKYNGTDMEVIKSGNTTNFNYFVNETLGLSALNVLLTGYSNGNTAGVIFGTGSTPPSLDDYCLSGDVVSTLVMSVTKQAEKVNGGITITMLYSITNTGDDAVTISEMGYFGCLNASSNQNSRVLLERTVLESPLTIESGGVGQVTYTIRMNYPTA